MQYRSVIVLKFGGSVLKNAEDAERAALEIYGWRRQGFQVIAVVSAVSGTTDRLSQLASESLAQTDSCLADEGAKANLLATGEVQSAALIGIALQKAGILGHVASVHALGLRATGPRLDAELSGLDQDRLQAWLDKYGVVVVPGFIGADEQDELCLLGRGGSDLTALFIASKLGCRCRLIKDVDGLYEFDPNQRTSGKVGPGRSSAECAAPKRYSQVTYADALRLDESIVQHKAVRYAEQRQLPFEVSSWNADFATVVGATASHLREEPVAGREKMRVVLLGVGTVGLGVYQHLDNLLADSFEVVAVACRNRQKAVQAGIDAQVLVDSVIDAVDAECDVVIELVGGTELPAIWIRRALQQGTHVVTANKSLLAADLSLLQEIAEKNSTSLSYSASVGGGVPALESLQLLQRHGGKVVEIEAVLNGTCNFVLNEIQKGLSFEEALTQAKLLGLAEANPTQDLSGIDAAEKLALLAARCGQRIDSELVPRQPLSLDWVQSEFENGKVFRQLARLEFSDGCTFASVKLDPCEADSIWSELSGAGNAIRVKTEAGDEYVCQGVGAGRWPTTTSVLADLLDLEKRHRERTVKKTLESTNQRLQYS